MGFWIYFFFPSLLIRICNNTLIVADVGNPSFVILLDIIAAFDTLNRGILLNHLEKYVGLSGSVIQQFKSYYNHRLQFVNIISPHSSSYIVIWSHLLQCHLQSHRELLLLPCLLSLPAAFRSYKLQLQRRASADIQHLNSPNAYLFDQYSNASPSCSATQLSPSLKINK